MVSSELEWRVLPEFPKYEITEDGDVRNRETGKPLQEYHNKKTGVYSYCLRIDGNSSTNRGFWGLVHSAWPELNSGWKDIPDFPGYQVNKKGDVRGTLRYLVLTRTPSGLYRLRRDGKRHLWCIGELGNEEDIKEFWGEEAA